MVIMVKITVIIMGTPFSLGRLSGPFPSWIENHCRTCQQNAYDLTPHIKKKQPNQKNECTNDPRSYSSGTQTDSPFVKTEVC
jgi:multimeric flavodoxin WrbA